MHWIEDYGSKGGRPAAAGGVVFTINGDNQLPEQTLDHWEGYRGSGPVRIGNDAVSQFQGDIYGELMDAFYLSNKYVSPTSYDAWVKIRNRLEWICENWQRPDAGIWEMRNRQEHFVYSKVMNWVALDRGLRLADKRAFPADRTKCMRERMVGRPVVWLIARSDGGRRRASGASRETPGGGGVARESRGYRCRPQPRIDGRRGEEGTFNICSFWLVEALARAGLADAEKL